MMTAPHNISTGSRRLDDLLGGGVSQSAVTLVYGEPSSGKTSFAITVTANHLRSEPAAKAIYIDADGKLSLPRLLEVFDTKIPDILKRIIYAKPINFEAQGETIGELPEKLEKGDLLILDSITGLYRVETGDALKTWAENKELNRQLGQLKEIALTCKVALILTGQVHAIIDSATPQIEPVAQRLLRFWSDTIIRLETTSQKGIRRVIVEKPETHRGSTRVQITAAGVADEEEGVW